MNEFLKYTPSWYEVLTEQESQIKLSCSGNSRKSKVKKMEWETIEQYNFRVYCYEHDTNSKAIKAYKRILKYGYPKRCPIINKITNLILFL